MDNIRILLEFLVSPGTSQYIADQSLKFTDVIMTAQENQAQSPSSHLSHKLLECITRSQKVHGTGLINYISNQRQRKGINTVNSQESHLISLSTWPSLLIWSRNALNFFPANTYTKSNNNNNPNTDKLDESNICHKSFTKILLPLFWVYFTWVQWEQIWVDISWIAALYTVRYIENWSNMKFDSHVTHTDFTCTSFIYLLFYFIIMRGERRGVYIKSWLTHKCSSIHLGLILPFLTFLCTLLFQCGR